MKTMTKAVDMSHLKHANFSIPDFYNPKGSNMDSILHVYYHITH